MRAFLLLFALGACGSESLTTDAATADDAGPIVVDDGTPMRRPCTNDFGSALSSSYGRLDGYLVAIVQPGSGGCNADNDHVHLQVLASGSVYDISVNVGSPQVDDVRTTRRDFTFLPWDEGWHTGVSEDYVARGVRSTELVGQTRTQLASTLTTELATVNHISIFAVGYGPDGAHLVHRNGNGRDGLIITQPLSRPSQARMFAFSDQTF
jgi:hypothetical protein